MNPALPSRYDLFLAVALKLLPARNPHPPEVVRRLESLMEEGLVEPGEGGLTVRPSAASRRLTELLVLALGWNIDDNRYLEDPSLVELIRAGYRQEFLTREDGPVTRERLLELVRDGMLVAHAYKPLLARFVQNLFLDRLLAWLEIPPKRPSGRVRGKAERTLLKDLLERKLDERRDLAALHRRLTLPEEARPENRLSPYQRSLRERLMRSDALADARALLGYEAATELACRQARRKATPAWPGSA